jgi:hypothetical protein
MEVILLFQLGERFGFEAGLAGIGNKGGTTVTWSLASGGDGKEETEDVLKGTFGTAYGL